MNYLSLNAVPDTEGSRVSGSRDSYDLEALVFPVVCMNITGLTAVMMGFMLLIFEVYIQPIISRIAFHRTGRHVKTAGCLLETAMSGPVYLLIYFSFEKYAAQSTHGEPYSFAIAVFSAGTIFRLYFVLWQRSRFIRSS